MDQYRKNRGKVRTRAEGVLKPPQVGENGGTRWAQCWTNCVCILVLLEHFSRPREAKNHSKNGAHRRTRAHKNIGS